MSEPRPSWLAWLALQPIYFYQRFVSKALHSIIPGSGCRFTPSCSEYAVVAYKRFGFFYGSWLTVKRVGRCHPYGGCGVDEVPLAKGKSG